MKSPTHHERTEAGRTNHGQEGLRRPLAFLARTIDNLLTPGLPHVKYGKRRVRICIAEADEWMRQKFGTQRRGPARTTAGLTAAE